MRSEIRVPLYDMLNCLSNAVDMVSPALHHHHRRVAYISLMVGADLGLSDGDLGDIAMAGALHDIGALSLRERLDELDFELDSPYRHAELGYRHLKRFGPLAGIAPLVRYHHVPWNGGEGRTFRGDKVPFGSHVLQLAERVDMLIDRKRGLYRQAAGIIDTIRSRCGRKFMPEVAGVFIGLARDEAFWATMGDQSAIDRALAERSGMASVILNLEGLTELAGLFGRIVDFRSRFTAVHSSGVASTSEALSFLMGMPEYESKLLRVAGHLHDLGKLAVPPEILDKPGKLTGREAAIVRRHSSYTFNVLNAINGLSRVNEWASFHHERIDGKGYPFGKSGDELSLGSRIIAVADVFTALMEDRPYRRGMEAGQAFGIMRGMAGERALDHDIVSTLVGSYDEINYLRKVSQSGRACMAGSVNG